MKNRKCISKHCRKQAKDGSLCYSCAKRKYKQNHPVKYAYNTLKQNAKRRGKVFELTFEQFQEFCIKYDYIQGKGVTKESYSIDRIDNSKGYTIDNIQILSVSENSRKGKKILNCEYDVQTGKLIAFVKNSIPDFDKTFNQISENIDKNLNHEEFCLCSECHIESPF